MQAGRQAGQTTRPVNNSMNAITAPRFQLKYTVATTAIRDAFKLNVYNILLLVSEVGIPLAKREKRTNKYVNLKGRDQKLLLTVKYHRQRDYWLNFNNKNHSEIFKN